MFFSAVLCACFMLCLFHAQAGIEQRNLLMPSSETGDVKVLVSAAWLNQSFLRKMQLLLRLHCC